jgi:hypothetical protein
MALVHVKNISRYPNTEMFEYLRKRQKHRDESIKHQALAEQELERRLMLSPKVQERVGHCKIKQEWQKRECPKIIMKASTIDDLYKRNSMNRCFVADDSEARGFYRNRAAKYGFYQVQKEIAANPWGLDTCHPFGYRGNDHGVPSRYFKAAGMAP